MYSPETNEGKPESIIAFFSPFVPFFPKRFNSEAENYKW